VFVKQRIDTRWLLLLLLVLVAAVTLVGCGREGTGAAAVPEDVSFVIPRGAAAGRMRGETVVAIPSKIHLVTGQAVAVTNQDQAMHYFFSAPIAPGQTLRKSFDEPGTYNYRSILSCSISETESVTVEVSER